MEFRVESEVGEDGMVHIATPELPVGTAVRVTVEEKPIFKGERIFGQLRGKIHVYPNFDDPIEGLEWAY